MAEDSVLQQTGFRWCEAYCRPYRREMGPMLSGTGAGCTVVFRCGSLYLQVRSLVWRMSWLPCYCVGQSIPPQHVRPVSNLVFLLARRICRGCSKRMHTLLGFRLAGILLLESRRRARFRFFGRMRHRISRRRLLKRKGAYSSRCQIQGAFREKCTVTHQMTTASPSVA